MQKGPVGPLLVLVIIAVYLTATRGWRRGATAWRAHLAGAGIFLLLTLPWFLLVLARLPRAWDVWLRESAGRFEGFDHIKGPHYFVQRVLGDGQPWVLFALLAPGLLRAGGADRRRLLFPLVWAGVTLLFFSIPSSKKSYYVLPIYPALGLLAARVLTAADAMEGGAVVVRGVRWLWAILGGALCLAGLVAYPAYHLALKKGRINPAYAEHDTLIWFAVGLLLVLGATLLVCARRFLFLAAATALGAGTLLAFGMYIHILPNLNRHKGDRVLCEYLRPRLAPEDVAFTYGVSGVPVFTFYLDRPVIRIWDPHALFDGYIDRPQPGRVFFLIKDREYEKLLRTFIVRAGTEDLSPQIHGEPPRGALRPIVRRIAAMDGLTWLTLGVTARPTPEGEARPVLPAPGRSAGWVSVQLEDLPDAEKSNDERIARRRALLEEALAGLPHHVIPMGTFLRRVDHPPVPSECFWVEALPLLEPRLPAEE